MGTQALEFGMAQGDHGRVATVGNHIAGAGQALVEGNQDAADGPVLGGCPGIGVHGRSSGVMAASQASRRPSVKAAW